MSERGDDTILDVNEDIDSPDESPDESYVTCRDEMTYIENNEENSEDDEQNSTIGGGNTNDSVHDYINSVDNHENTQDNFRSPFCQEERSIESPSCQDERNIESPSFREERSIESPSCQEERSIESPFCREGRSIESPSCQEERSIESPSCQEERSIESPSCQEVIDNSQDGNFIHQNDETYQENEEGENLDQSEDNSEENNDNENFIDQSEENYDESHVEENAQLNSSVDFINDKEEESQVISSPEHTDQHTTQDKQNEDNIYDVENLQENEINSLSLDDERNTELLQIERQNNTKNRNRNFSNNKRRSDEGLEIRDELDFEEEKEESAEEGEESDGNKENEKEPINKEEGELTDEDEEDSSLRQEPKTVCRFFNKGQCTWGTNCRFLHPGVSDKGNYNMFAAPKPPSQAKEEESTVDKERPREVRRYVPEPAGFESAWERGLRHAKEMMKRANKRKETDADFEEKRFNLSLGQAELDRENDYYTRPASPVYKPSDEVIEYLDPYEKQAIRHFRGGHFENFEVRYKVNQSSYPNRGPQHIRSRRDKFEREVTERVPPRKMRATSPVTVEKHNKPVKEKRYPRPTYGKDDRAQDTPAVGKGEAEVWADPWARRRTPVKRTKKVSRNRSYSSGSSSGSSRSSRSSSYSSYSRSGSRSSSRSRSSRSSSRSITPPVHPRQQRATMNRGGRGGRGRGFDRGGGRGGGPPRNFYHSQQQYSQPPNPPPNHPLAPDVNFLRQNQMGPPSGGGFNPNRRGRGRDDNRFANFRHQNTRNMHQPSNERVPPMQFKQEPREKNQETKEKIIPIQRNANPRQNPTESNERVDMFGRTIRKDVARSVSKSPKRHPPKPHGRRRFSLSPSRSRSGSRSGSSSSSGSSASRSRSRSSSRSRSRSSRSSSGSSATPPPSPVNRKKVERTRRPPPPPAPAVVAAAPAAPAAVATVSPALPTGTVSYGDSNKSKVIDLVKVAGQKQQIKLTLKKPGPVKQVDRTVLDVDDDSGESDTDARILKKRKIDVAPVNPPPAKKPRAPSPTAIASMTTGTVGIKKPSAARREELLKQLRAVEDAIARKRSKPL